MRLETLRDFEWYNEAKEVSFGEHGVKITASPGTDFWIDGGVGYSKDNGHFFFCRRQGSFGLTVCWRFGIPINFAQCGLMVRVDESQWCKISIVSKNGNNQNIASVVTHHNGSDMAMTPIPSGLSEIWFRIKRNNDGAFELFYSTNGVIYTAIRRFRLTTKEEVCVGVFMASPSEKTYTAILSSIEFSDYIP